MLAEILPYLTAWNILGVLVVFFTARTVLGWVQEDRKIAALGGPSKKRKSWLPLGIDIIYEGVTAGMAHRNLENYTKMMSYGHPNNPHTTEVHVGGRRVILTGDPENIKAILATQFHDFGKGKDFNEEWHDFLGDSIFTTDGEKWHDSRQLIRPQFIKDRISDLAIFERHFQILLPHLKSHGQTIDIAKLFFKYTLDAATDFLLGRSVDSLINDQSLFSDAFGDVQRIQNIMVRWGPALGKYYPRKHFYKQLGVLNNFVEPFIDEALALPPEELDKKTKSDEGYTFLHAIAGYTRNRQVLRDQLVAVLLAGRDTTACTLSWLFHELSKRPDAVRRLRAEIEATVGLEPQAQPTYAHLKSMKFLNHCLNETLRLYPVVPFNVRVSLKDTTIPRGGGADGNQPVGMVEGTNVAYSTLYMQRRADLYPGPETGFPPVDQFVPERWDGWTPKMWTYIPFNGGPRICVGQQFALTEMAYTTTRILQNFETLEARQSSRPEFKADIVLIPAGGVKVALHAGEKSG